MRMTASWFGSLDLPHTRLWRDSTAPKSGLPSDCHPPHHRARSRQDEAGEIQPRADAGKHALPCLTQKAPYKGPCADSVEKHEPASDIDTAVVDSLKALDHQRPIREADSCTATTDVYSITASARATTAGGISSPMALAVFRLMTNSNLVGCNTGRSAGFSPFEQSCRSERIATVNELN
jgi:hypothetical protein